jgi:hypothetical protein
VRIRGTMLRHIVIVNTAGQIALFVPGGQGIGTLLMTLADIGETSFDVYDYGVVQGVMNGGVRFTIGRLGAKFVPTDFNGSKLFQMRVEGGIEILTEITENQAVNLFNSY